ncbi:MAG: hypothetical protein VXW29_12495 [SAR324 cluster bacterium]|nr:hypothetical protein [SAR324 cluster bacterium]
MSLTTPRRSAIRDEWQRIKHLFPGRMGTVGVTAKNNLLFIVAMLLPLAKPD